MRAPLLLLVVAVVALAVAAVLWPWARFGEPGEPPVDSGGGATATALQTTGSGTQRVPVSTADSDREVDPHVGVVRVLCRTENDEPLAGCKVTIGEADARLSGADGAVEVDLAPGRQWLDVQPADAMRCPVRQRVTAVGGRVTEVVATLPPRFVPEFWCRILAAEDQQPIVGARLSIEPSADGEAASGDDGLVRVPLGGEAEYVRVMAPGRSPRRIVPVAGHATAPLALDVPLERAAELQLTVVDSQDQPVADADVSITAMAWSLRWPATAPVRGGPELWSHRLDADGTGAMADLPPNCPLFVTVTPPADSAAPGTVTWELVAGVNVRRLQLQPLGELHGRVLDAGGRPVGAAQVVAILAAADDAVDMLPAGAVGESILSAADGSFQLDALQPGTWLLSLRGTEGFSARCRRVEVLPGARVKADVRAEVALSIRGRLLGPGNEPISAFEVHALRGGTVIATAITERDGSYELQSLPAGEYDVSTELYQSELAMAAPVRASAGRSNVDIRVVSVLGNLRGHFIAAGSRGGDVWLRGLRRGGREYCGGRCDLDGRFEQPRQRAGIWDLAVSDAHGNVGVLHGVELIAGRTTPDLEITMRPGAVVRPVHPSADAFRIERGADVVARDALERGLPAEVHVPPGAWTVVFLRGGFEVARREIAIAAGEQQMVSGG